MLPWVGEVKGLEVSPVPATPGDGACRALLSSEQWESSTFPRDTARPRSSSSHWKMRNHEHKWAEQISASFLSPSSCRYQTRSFPALLLHAAALLYQWGFSFSHVAVEGRFSPGALKHRHGMRNSDWLQLGRGTSQAGGKESAVCLERPQQLLAQTMN